MTVPRSPGAPDARTPDPHTPDPHEIDDDEAAQAESPPEPDHVPPPDDDPDGGPGDDLVVPLIGEKLVIRRRYEAMSIVNDIIASLFFIGGSILYFFDSLVIHARVLFLCGSVLMLVRPLIRLRRRIYLTRENPHDSGDDASTWY